MKLSIGKRLFLGFGVLLFIVLIFGIYIIVTSQKNKNVSEKILNIYAPSKALLNSYYNIIDNSKMLIKSWVFIDKIPETPDKLRLENLHDSIFPALVKELDEIKNKWEAKDEKLLDEITIQIKDTLFVQHKTIMTLLGKFEAYDDPEVVFQTQPAVEDGGEVIEMTKKILDKLSILQGRINEQVTIANQALNKSNESFQTYIIVLFILLIITSVITALLTSRSILRPVNRLNNTLTLMSHGEMPEIELVDTGDEIGEMSLSLNNVVHELRKTIIDIKDSAVFLSDHSKTLTKQARILSKGASEQASYVQEINGSIKEIISSLDKNAENSKLVESHVLNFVNSIKSNKTNVSETVKALKKISAKINDVNEISSHTNILSLNALIEAARAGEHGKGFTVVAQEVGKLADRSKIHAKEIEDLSVLSIQIANTTDEVSDELIPQIQNTQKLIGNITSAISELSSLVIVIHKTAVNLNGIAQQNSSFSDDMSNNSKNLESQVAKLMRSVSFFKIGDLNMPTSVNNNKEIEIVKEINEADYNSIKKETENTIEIISEDKKLDFHIKETGFNLDLDGEKDDNFETF